VVAAPQLPAPGGDVWLSKAVQVKQLALDVVRVHDGDSDRAYLTGFSYGGDGVLDLGRAQPGMWAALRAVDPTRLPHVSPDGPIWVSVGEQSRQYISQLERVLGAQQLEAAATARPR
jgi:dienelactone hydrolase